MNKEIQNLTWLHPLVYQWFVNKFIDPTDPQIRSWPHILAGRSTLISAPTGSGKTFSAFLICIDTLVRKALQGILKFETEVLYISPLKALNNDIHKNLLEPLNEISELAKASGIPMQDIKVAVRSGDTLSRERQAMVKKPPHILVTTPESFYVLLTAEKSRANLEKVKTVIVDEIHAMANNKRGSHLSLSLERLEHLCNHSLLRIGLSATQKPLEQIARFLVGSFRKLPEIINIGYSRSMELAVEIPKTELAAVASNDMWDEIYDKLAELTRKHRSILVFVNTRRLAERVAHHLSALIGEEQVATHHGSLSRKLRLAAETKLKNGQLKILVATASLELGIDIGFVDLVCQIGSPRAIAITLQRIGRSGHWHQGISKGYLFATTRDELIECAAIVNAIKNGCLDHLIIPHQPLDILSQQIIAICATETWDEDNLYEMIKNAYPYHCLSRETFNSIIVMLTEGITGTRGRYGGYLIRDQINKRVSGRRGSRITALMNGGAIPENGLFTVISEPNNIVVGTLDEDFAIESNRGDIILLGSSSWQIKSIESIRGKVIVEDAHGAAPNVPFWRGEAPARTQELSLRVANLRQTISEMLAASDHSKTLDWLKNCGLNEYGVKQVIQYIQQGQAVLNTVATQKTIIAERFFDESGGMQLIIHAPFGARINKAWGLALRKRFCRSFNFELQAAATDNGLNIALAQQHSFPLADVFKFLNPKTVKQVLIQAVLQSALFKTRWRWDAARSLALVRFRGGKKIPPNILRMLADDLLAAVFPDATACQDNLAGRDIELPDHPLINETIKDCLSEALDVDGLISVLEKIQKNEITCLAIDTPMPSVFAHEILNANPYAFLDDAPLEERRARAVAMRQILPENLQNIGKLDLEIINEVQQQAWPDIRNAEELHDMLQTLIAFPIDEKLSEFQQPGVLWKSFFEELTTMGRTGIAVLDTKRFWLVAEKAKSFAAIYPHSCIECENIDFESSQPEREQAILNMLRNWMLHLGPTTSSELAKILKLSISDIEQALLMLEVSGLILRGNFRNIQTEQLEWCERKLLARIHRLTVSKLREEIEPVTVTQFMRWLLIWQHLAPGTQLKGEQGLLEVIKKLQGYELPANAWERQIFARRVSNYSPEMLDHLCLMGAIGWGRVAIHPAITEPTEDALKKLKRVLPKSTTPITFFVRKNNWILQHFPEKHDLTALTYQAKKVYNFLKQNGASFFADIVNEVGHLRAEIEMALWELVAAGFITADSFDNLRGLIHSKRRLQTRYRREQSTARWSLLSRHKVISSDEYVESSCQMLLNRYGIIFRDLLAKEKNIPSWRELLFTFRRLESQGEIRGGRFISNFSGEQFALPYALESLRALRKDQPSEEIVKLAAVDPLNLIGVILPGARISAISKSIISLKNGMSDTSNCFG